jgi:hypothetical protein
VSTTVKPVTQAAEVAVNKASIGEVKEFDVLEMGSSKRTDPIRIKAMKLKKSDKVDENGLFGSGILIKGILKPRTPIVLNVNLSLLSSLTSSMVISFEGDVQDHSLEAHKQGRNPEQFYRGFIIDRSNLVGNRN